MNYLFIKICPPASARSAGNCSDGSSGPSTQQKHKSPGEVGSTREGYWDKFSVPLFFQPL